MPRIVRTVLDLRWSRLRMLYAGRNAPPRPITTDVATADRSVEGRSESTINASTLSVLSSSAESPIPMTPPTSATTSDSPMTIPRICDFCRPKLRRIPTSRVRSRTDMETLLAAPKMLTTIAANTRSPSMRRICAKSESSRSRASRSDSVFVGLGAFLNSESIARLTADAAAGSFSATTI